MHPPDVPVASGSVELRAAFASAGVLVAISRGEGQVAVAGPTDVDRVQSHVVRPESKDGVVNGIVAYILTAEKHHVVRSESMDGVVNGVVAYFITADRRNVVRPESKDGVFNGIDTYIQTTDRRHFIKTESVCMG